MPVKPYLLLVPQDPLETVRAKCEESEHCVHAKERLELCEARVNSRTNTEEDCTEELFDFLHARDHCVSVWNWRERVSWSFWMMMLMPMVLFLFVFVGSTQAVS